jgi:hypothetical protein
MINGTNEHFDIREQRALARRQRLLAERDCRRRVSINAGCFRLLVPQSQQVAISEMRSGAKYIVVSMLPRDKWVDRQYCLEWMVEDGSDIPWTCHVFPGAVDRAPNHEDVGKEWRGSVWGLSTRSPPQMLGASRLAS